MSDVQMEIESGRWVPAVPLRIVRWWHYLTGGRPMDLIGFAFTDIINGRPVNYYQDAFGRRWMAQGAWALFRVDLAERSDATPAVDLAARRHSNGDTK